MKRIAIFLGLSLLVVAVLGLLVQKQRRKSRTEFLSKVATLEYPVGSKELLAAIEELGRTDGEGINELLLSIASGEHPNADIWPDARIAAVKSLVKRKDYDSYALALTLQPYESLQLRRTIASALLNRQCNRDCLSAVLHYRERIASGELAVEDRFPIPPESLREEKLALDSDLDNLLRKHELETAAILSRVYGFGTVSPSPFALTLASTVGLRSVCPQMLYSLESSKNIRNFKIPLELQNAVGALKCDAAGSP